MDGATAERDYHERGWTDDERMFPKYAICSMGRLGLVETLGGHPFYADRDPSWAYKGTKVFPQGDEDPRWMSHASSARFLSNEDCDALDAALYVRPSH